MIRRHPTDLALRWVLAISLALALGGAGVVGVRADRGMCAHVQAIVAEATGRETGAQRWEDIHVLQTDVSRQLWLRHHATEICGGASPHP